MKAACRIFSIVVFLISFIACSKKDGGGGVCNTTKADAETIAIFPADNAWHRYFRAAVDAYGSQILGAYSGTGVKADFGSGLHEGNGTGSKQNALPFGSATPPGQCKSIGF